MKVNNYFYNNILYYTRFKWKLYYSSTSPSTKVKTKKTRVKKSNSKKSSTIQAHTRKKFEISSNWRTTKKKEDEKIKSKGKKTCSTKRKRKTKR